MRAFIAACVVAVVIAVGAGVILESSVQRPASEAFTTTGARI
jgi:hypothetical protein